MIRRYPTLHRREPAMLTLAPQTLGTAPKNLMRPASLRIPAYPPRVTRKPRPPPFPGFLSTAAA